MKLSFQPYKDLLKRTPYVAVASFFVQTLSEIREGNEVHVEDDSDFNVYVSDAAMSSSGRLLSYPPVPMPLIRSASAHPPLRSFCLKDSTPGRGVPCHSQAVPSGHTRWRNGC